MTTSLVAIGACALLVSIVNAITGGFELAVGPLHLTSHNLTTPLGIFLICSVAVVVYDRVHAAASMSQIVTFLERHATAIALVLAASAGGVGIAHGTYAASGSDASAYISQAHLIAAGHLTRREPLATEVGWPDAGWSFSPLGYRPGRNLTETVPGYPAGLPILMALALIVAGADGPYFVVPLLGVLLVSSTYLLGARLHSRLAGLIGAALVATSPIVLFEIVQPMTDVAATAWWTIALLLAVMAGPASAFASGMATGLALLTRPNLGPLVLPVIFALMDWKRQRLTRSLVYRRLLPFAVGVVPAIVARGLMQWRLFGDPLASGHGALGELFDAANIAPNIRGYAARLLTAEAPALCLALTALIVVAAMRRRTDGRPRVADVTPALSAALWCGVIVLACYLPYGVFPEWWSLRFLLPALPPLFIAIGAVLAQATGRLPDPARGAIILIALTIACSANVSSARRGDTFKLYQYESRYWMAGRYLESALPASAVILAVQHSGSARFYTGRPVVRWDALPGDLDEVITRLRSLGRYPVVLIEGFEAEGLRTRFPSSAVAKLDWPARAAFGDAPPTRLFDPADRDDATHVWPTDRVQ